ncbi:DUF4129 domain-containing protein [Salinibacterium sp. SYSU T00001]|uniref:DUF4129 domain-containing protein n=1 Tax=Homoserinimonas sedimenticola TaxID=2986805 RepID=UPI002235E80B|nr:DUF4129 domain-containing protein [Salinibacterium sedimenticola]MCW4384991.1 DUF4129 domain-containing protein [Salinibacterium sedimenticola]
MTRALLSTVDRAAAPFEIPVEPDAPEAREWLLRELSNREYLEAQPNWFDRLATALWEWLTSLRIEAGPGGQGLGVLLVALLVLALIVAAFIIFGRPALSRRSRVTTELFGAEDTRDSLTLRRAAESHAAQKRWDDAVTDMFRAIARGLSERTVVSTLPGTTAQDFAARAAKAFPDHGGELAASADDFDGVRYLEHPATAEQYERVRALEASIRAARPRLEPGVMAAGAQEPGA